MKTVGLPVFEALRKWGVVKNPNWDQFDALTERVLDSVKVDASESTAWWATVPWTRAHSMRSELRSRPPFPCMWFEFARDIYQDICVEPGTSSDLYAALALEVHPAYMVAGLSDADPLADDAVVVAVFPFVLLGGRVHQGVAAALLSFDSDGRSELYRAVCVNPSVVDGSDEDGESAKAVKRWVYQVARCVIGASALMHCRNVAVEERSTSGRRGKHSKRTSPTYDYGVIRLPVRRSTGGDSASLGGERPLHLVRGHFKTYTEERPLLGRHTGTYWWGWQARGNAENGRTFRDYSVAPSEDGES